MVSMSAGERREEQRHHYNAYLAECPGHQLLATLSDKWVTLVLSALADGPLRYAQLSGTVAGATQKMLTQTLRKLERDGLVSRTVTPEIPPRVDYGLTIWAGRFFRCSAPSRTGPRRTSMPYTRRGSGMRDAGSMAARRPIARREPSGRARVCVRRCVRAGAPTRPQGFVALRRGGDRRSVRVVEWGRGCRRG
jgi:DNA-binding HxlR family transcriptional regulator